MDNFPRALLGIGMIGTRSALYERMYDLEGDAIESTNLLFSNTAQYLAMQDRLPELTNERVEPLYMSTDGSRVASVRGSRKTHGELSTARCSTCARRT